MATTTIEVDMGRTPPPALPNTPNTRKRQREYVELADFGLQGRPIDSLTNRLQKKARIDSYLRTNPPNPHTACNKRNWIFIQIFLLPI